MSPLTFISGYLKRVKKVERKFEIAARIHTSSEFSHNSRTQELTLAKCTHIMVSHLKAW